MEDKLEPLRALALRHANGRLTQTDLSRLFIVVSPAPSGPQSGVYSPMICLVLQGAKEATIGSKAVRYDSASYLITSLELPACGRVIEASPERPYICLSLAFDLDMIAALMPEVPSRGEAQTPAFAVSAVTPDLLDAFHRLLGLLDKPEDIAVLAPLFEREIIYRLLLGPQSCVLRQIAQAGSRMSQVRRAIDWIKAHYSEPLRIETLAELAGMSAATFHRHFKAATAMSPLQYQKNLRLQQARRLLVTAADAARAGYAVGYESASQFSREYARMFGIPPARDAARLRGLSPEEIAGA